MPRITKWENVGMSFYVNALPEGSAAESVSKAVQGSATVAMSAHGFSDGDYLAITCEEGMWQLDGMVVRITDVTTDSFALENVRTTYFDTSVEGATYFAKVPNWNAKITTAMSVSTGNASHEMLDATTIHKSTKIEVPGMSEAGTMNFECIWDPFNDGMKWLQYASEAQQEVPFKLQFGAGTGSRIMTFLGRVACNLAPSGAAQQIAKTSLAVTMVGSPTYYVYSE